MSTLFSKDGTVLVDPKRCPTLHRSLVRSHGHAREGWARVVELRATGQEEMAARLVRRLLGVQGEPMSEEKKEALRRWKEEHKDEIKERKQTELEVRKRTLALLKTGPRRTR